MIAFSPCGEPHQFAGPLRPISNAPRQSSSDAVLPHFQRELSLPALGKAHWPAYRQRPDQR
jgi:hypothetical protein